MAWTAIIPIALGFLGFGGGSNSVEGGNNSGRNIKWILIFTAILVVLFLAFSIYLNYENITFTDYFYKLFTGFTKEEFDNQQDGRRELGKWYLAILSPAYGIVTVAGGLISAFARRD